MIIKLQILTQGDIGGGCRPLDQWVSEYRTDSHINNFLIHKVVFQCCWERCDLLIHVARSIIYPHGRKNVLTQATCFIINLRCSFHLIVKSKKINNLEKSIILFTLFWIGKDK